VASQQKLCSSAKIELDGNKEELVKVQSQLRESSNHLQDQATQLEDLNRKLKLKEGVI